MTSPSVSLFGIRPPVIRTTLGLGDALKRCGIRHVEVDAVYDLHELPWCKAEGWRVIAIGDNFMRTLDLQAKNCTFQKVSNSAWTLGKSGICDRVELTDEMNPDPRSYPELKAFGNWWNQSGGPPISCPGWAPQTYERMPGLTRAVAGGDHAGR